jgi:hypothetical protein
MKQHAHTHKHANFFAPVLICLVFGSAIVMMFPVIFASSSNVVRAMNFDDCAKLSDSRIQESYPPVCVTKSGKSFTKDLPKIKMPEGQ